MQFGNYYETMDQLEDIGPRQHLTPPGEKEEALPKSFMGPEFLGTPLNPFQHQLAALNAKIKSGAGKIEFNFPGKGKGTSQSPTPESYGKRERRDMKELLEVAGVKSSIHATFGLTGFSGLGERGFSDQAQEENLKEIKKAIEFAAEATQGGAVVFHTGEYMRAPGEFNDKENKFNTFSAAEAKMKDEGFNAPEHRNKMHYIVDSRTGQMAVNPINESQRFYEPIFRNAKMAGVVGKYDEKVGRELKEFDLVDVHGNYIDPMKEDDMFNRVPEFNSERTAFQTDDYDWGELQKRTEQYNKDHKTNLTPALYKAKMDMIDRGLAARANSIYHGQRYDDYRKSEEKLKESLKMYEELEQNMDEKDLFKIMMQDRNLGIDPALVRTSYDKPSNLIKKELQQVQNSLAHIHQSSASADAQAREAFHSAEKLDTMENVGKQRSAEGIARMGMHAWQQTKRWNPDKPVYVAPENLWVGQYGSHPDEIIDLTLKARKEMVKRLENQGIKGKDAEKLANDHIKSTIDVGHLNMWKQYYKKDDPNVSPQQRDKDFKKWVLEQTDKMIKKGVVGHIHVSDNFGYDDEHLTPGEGNAPIKEFLEAMEKKGYKDIIIEPGAFNPDTILHDAWAYLDSPIYGARPTPGFRSIHQQQFGRNAPPFYVVGGYAPTNEWRLWSEVPLE